MCEGVESRGLLWNTVTLTETLPTEEECREGRISKTDFRPRAATPYPSWFRTRCGSRCINPVTYYTWKRNVTNRQQEPGNGTENSVSVEVHHYLPTYVFDLQRTEREVLLGKENGRKRVRQREDGTLLYLLRTVYTQGPGTLKSTT